MVRKDVVRRVVPPSVGSEQALWHDEAMVMLARIVGRLIEDALRWLMLLARSTEAVRAENLMLRRQLAMFMERGVCPRRMDAATRVSLAVLARLFDWRGALVVVQPATMVRWHRAGWRLLWRMKSRPGRPPIPRELRLLIRRLGQENPLWGEERTANELLLKLGVRVSPRTVRKYLPKRPQGRPRGDQRWSTFLKNHAKAILACDFFVAVTATFRLLYVFVVHRARQPPTDARERHRAPERGLDAAADERSGRGHR